VAGATGYRIQLQTNDQFGTILFDNIITTTTYFATLPAQGHYIWRVQAVNDDGVSVWSASRLTLYVSPTLISPVNMEVITTPSVELNWDVVEDAIGYEVQVAPDDTFNTVINNVVVDTTTTTQTIASSDDYYWRVRAIGEFDDGTWSDVRQFTITLPIINQTPNEQDLFNVMQTNLTESFQFAIMDVRPNGIMTTLQFDDGTVADVMVNMNLDNGLIIITLSDIVIQGGGTQAHLDMLYQDVPTMMMNVLNDMLPPDYVSIDSLTLTDTGMSITVIAP
ncbi:MAG TPA: hypothetical protein PLZ51_22670, partial [Aggregatilineales bacterium]|nr:hypothetical protein [Aggregatilineales bacterium]